MNKYFLLIISLIALNFSFVAKDIKLKSPSKNLTVKIVNEKSSLKLKLFNSNRSILEADLGGFIFDKNLFENGFEITDIKKSSINENWDTVYGERSTVRNNYNELEITLTDRKDATNSMKLICRAYDEGFAFRYLFDPKFTSDIIISEELTTFSFGTDHYAWITNRAQGEYKKDKISSITKGCERPLVIKLPESYVAIGEAGLVNFARMKFKNNPKKEFSIQTELDGKVNLKKANYRMPWRFVMVGKSPGELLENNYFIQNLNAPNEIEDTSWIKPGKVIREVTLTTQGGIACVDFAASHNLQYVEFDAGWYGNEYDDASDASTITVDPKRSPGPLGLHHVIEYANKKGVGIILYVNQRALEKQLDEVLPMFELWGVKGLKYGFMNVGSQEWTTWLHDAIRKAAKYHLMVDVHDEYRPTGYERTYPNLMTQEGIRGDEESPSSEHTLTTLFTRMIAGAGDNTNCYLAPRVSEKMGGKTGQMAKAVLLYSPWQFLYWYDRPEESPHKKGGAGAASGILKKEDKLDFYEALPASWDKTIVLEGGIGEHATMARKNGENWFVGSLAGAQGHKTNISLDFLDKKEDYEAVIFFQSEKDLNMNTVSIEKIKVNKKTVLSKELLKNAGLAIIIKKL